MTLHSGSNRTRAGLLPLNLQGSATGASQMSGNSARAFQRRLTNLLG